MERREQVKLSQGLLPRKRFGMRSALPLGVLERVVERLSSLSNRSLSTSSSACHEATPTQAPASTPPSYTDTIILPKTDFPLRANAVTRERLFRSRTTSELYAWQLNQVDRPLFILHDGPPYANGQLHTGHFLNKTLKDIINRSRLLQGYRVHYVPGYDTHGLPLELKALASMKARRGSLTPQQVREGAKREAEKGIEVQAQEFSEFGGMGAFGTGEAYRTLDWSYEKRQLGVFKEMARKGLITTHHRPTLYSASSRTALAEAEIEYKEDHVSRSVYVAFPVSDLGRLAQMMQDAGVEGEEVHLAVWTTTPWTLPGNVAIAVSETLQYTLARNSRDGCLLVVASERLVALEQVLSSPTFPVILSPVASFPGSTLLETRYSFPLASFSDTRPLFPASYVTSTTGTGLVHTAPAHGVEDWEAWRAFQLRQRAASSFTSLEVDDVVCAVDEEGKFSDVLVGLVDNDVFERLLGMEVLGEGTNIVLQILEDQGILLRAVDVEHKYPYDWRTKKPVIFRASSQWFANLDKIKEDAVTALETVEFYPPRGRKAMELFVRGRSEWCISRQRSWGVPLPVVYSYHPSSHDPIGSSISYLTPSNVEHIISVLDSKKTGTDYWWEGTAEEFVEPAELERSKVEGREWRKGTDTMDVWFDSGVSWSFIRDLNLRPSSGAGSLPYADVYLEGGDQYRGWFQSSLLTAVAAGVNPTAPYGTVITHGMVLDDKGRKMSKSLGNVISPLSVIYGEKSMPAFGVDLLRLWVASVDSTRDVPIGREILDQIFEGLRKIRNTARFLIGSVANEPVELTPPALGLIERYMMNELLVLDRTAREGYNTFTFNKVYSALASFSNSTLSSFYFNIAKDSLYADSKSSPNRRALIFTLQKILETYLFVLAPMAPHLAEEIYHFSQGATADPSPGNVGAGSVFQKIWTPLDETWRDEAAKSEMEALFVVREEVLVLLEQARHAKFIRSSTEARVIVSSADSIVQKHHDVLATLFIVSDVELHAPEQPVDNFRWKFTKTLSSGMTVTILPVADHKCPRCWLHTRKEGPVLCKRCESVLSE